VRAAFLVTDAEDQTSFEGRALCDHDVAVQRALYLWPGFAEGRRWDRGRGKAHARARLPRDTPEQVQEGCALCGHHPPTAPGTVFRLINVHLDSLWDTLHYRAQQMEILANVLREPGCGGGIIAGDFNAISPEDDGSSTRTNW
jgi:tyrosyl-DNA phosphodiesterase 2